MKESKSILILPLVILVLIVIAVFTVTYYQDQGLEQVTDFDSCALAGYPIMESYPEQCITPDGRTFMRDISNESPAPISVSGEMVCLPHQDQTGPQTLECAFGLLAQDGHYYGLRDSSSDYSNLMGSGGSQVTVTGTFYPQTDTKYQSVGVIEVESVTPL